MGARRNWSAIKIGRVGVAQQVRCLFVVDGAEAYEKGMLPEMQTKRRSSLAPLPAQPELRDVLNRTFAA